MKRSRELLSLAFLAVASWVVAPLAAQPRAVVRTLTIDAGMIERGTTSETVFTIANEGDEPLELTEVKPACGCTVVDYDKVIAPGASGRVVATLNTKGMRGATAKTVRVFTNDASNAQIDLVIKANVRAYVEAEPGYARFLAVLGQGAEPVKQVVYSQEPGELIVTGVTSPLSFVEVTSHEASAEERLPGRAGRQWVLELRLTEAAPEGAFADFVEVALQHPHLRQMRIPVSGFVQPIVAVLPRVADFGRKDLAQPQTTVLEVKNLGKPAVTLGAVATTVKGLKPELEVVDEGRLFRLRLTLDPSMPKGDFSGTLTIPTSSALQPQVTIDVRGSIL
jgi:hypothetical protein